MKTKISLLLFIVLLIGCASNNQVYTISDITKKSEIVLNHSDTTKYIFSIHIAFKGEINGNVLINLTDGINYKKEYQIKKGAVDFIIDTDWYNTKCIINYEPQYVTKGKLFIVYKFFEQ